MSLRITCLSLLLFSLFTGCGENEPAAGVDHDADYALEIKARTFEFIDAWQKEPDEARGLFEGLSEQLAAFESFPVGTHKETYAELNRQMQEIQDSYGQVSNQQIEQLKATAEELPGDVSTFTLYD